MKGRYFAKSMEQVRFHGEDTDTSITADMAEVNDAFINITPGKGVWMIILKVRMIRRKELDSSAELTPGRSPAIRRSFQRQR